MGKNGKIAIVGFVVCIVLASVISFIYKADNEKLIVMRNAKDYVSSPQEYKFIVDSQMINIKIVRVDGYVVKLGTNSDYINNHIVLIDNNGNIFGLNTIMVKKSSVTELFHDGHNYDHSGLSAQGKRKNLLKGKYTVGVVIKEQDSRTYLLKSENIVEVN